MKKIKKLTAFLLALLCTIGCITACNDVASVPPSLDSALGDSESVLPDSDTEIGETPDTDTETDEAPPITPPVTPTPTPPQEEKPPATTPTPTPVKTYAKYIRCTGTNVNIRSGAGTSYTVLGSAQKGDTYTVLEEKNGWYKTYYRNNIAYIYASYATVFQLEKTNDEVESIIAEGYKLLGVPYVYGAVRYHDGKGNLLGGFSAQKFDCSSLMQYIFYKGAKIKLDVTTRTQVKQGKAVSKSELQRGDCLFFTNEDRQYNTGIERIGHVALYLGNNYILHTASDYACIEQISAYRWNFFIQARRFT